MGFAAIISAARARWLACDGNVSRVVMGPDGQLLDYGRSKRIVPPALRKAVEVQDPALRLRRLRGAYSLVRRPSCRRMGSRRGRDQPRELSPALRTALAPCVHHGFHVTRLPDGRWRTWRPDGTEIVLQPRHGP